MSAKYCSGCIQKLPLSSFLKDTLASPESRVFATCINCRAVSRKSANRKRTALRSLDPNIQPAKRARGSNTRPQPIIQAPLLPTIPIEPPLNLLTELQAPSTVLPPNPTELQPPRGLVAVLLPAEPASFLPIDEWR